jgi:hypothetical protein
VPRGGGKVVALGFLPMLAYAQGAGFKPTTLEEKWPEPPRRFAQLALDARASHRSRPATSRWSRRVC